MSRHLEERLKLQQFATPKLSLRQDTPEFKQRFINFRDLQNRRRVGNRGEFAGEPLATSLEKISLVDDSANLAAGSSIAQLFGAGAPTLGTARSATDIQGSAGKDFLINFLANFGSGGRTGVVASPQIRQAQADVAIKRQLEQKKAEREERQAELKEQQNKVYRETLKSGDFTTRTKNITGGLKNTDLMKEKNLDLAKVALLFRGTKQEITDAFPGKTAEEIGNLRGLVQRSGVNESFFRLSVGMLNSSDPKIVAEATATLEGAGVDTSLLIKLGQEEERQAGIARKSATLERKTIQGEQGKIAQEIAGGFTNKRLLELEQLGGLNLPLQPAPTTETPPTLTQEAAPATPKFGEGPSITETNIDGSVETPAPSLETQALTTSDLIAATAPAPEVDILNPVRLVADAIPNKIAKKQLTQQEALFLTNINAAVTTSNINEKAKLKFTAANIVDNIRTVATTMRLNEGVDYNLPKLTGRETPGQIQLMGETILDFLQTSFNEKKAGERVTSKQLTGNQLKQRQDHRNNELIYSVVETLIKDDVQPGSKQFNKIAQQALDDFRADRQGAGDKADYFGSPKEVEALMTDADVASGFSQALVDRLRAEPYNIANPQRDATGIQARDARADIFRDKLALVREEVQTKADLKALEEAGPIIFVIERMQGLVQGLLTNDVYWKRLFTDGIKNSINEIMQWSPEAAAYADERQAFATVLARAVESGRISDQDRLAFLNLIAETSGFFPDSLEKANMVFATVRQLFLRKVSPRVRQLLEADKDLRGEQLATDMEDILRAARNKIGIK